MFLKLSPFSLSSQQPLPHESSLWSLQPHCEVPLPPGAGQKIWEYLPALALLLELLQVVLQPHARHFGDREARGKVFIWCLNWEQEFQSRGM